MPDSTARAACEYLFQREGEYWTLAYDDTVARLRDSRGMRHLAQLLAAPWEKVAVTDMVAGSTKPPADGEPDAERARVNVTRAIATALQRIELHHPVLARHLSMSVRTGRMCSYNPDPRVPIRWRT